VRVVVNDVGLASGGFHGVESFQRGAVAFETGQDVGPLKARVALGIAFEAGLQGVEKVIVFLFFHEAKVPGSVREA
jgi:hypothetical protein